jgi:competence protein ComEA
MKNVLSRFAAVLALAALLAALPARPASAAGEVNINTASQEELVALPGVGPAKAKAIIDYRTAHPFKSVDEVKNVRGIGDHLYESLKGKITVGPVASSSAPSAEKHP